MSTVSSSNLKPKLWKHKNVWNTSRTWSKRTSNSTVRSRNSITNSPMNTTRNSKRLKKKFKRWLIPLWLRAIVSSKISTIRVNSNLMKLSTPKENSRNLPHKWTSLRIRSFVRLRKKRLRVPLVLEMISSLPPMGNGVPLPVKPKMVTGKLRSVSSRWPSRQTNSLWFVPKLKPNNLRRNRLTWLKKPRRHLAVLVPV